MGRLGVWELIIVMLVCSIPVVSIGAIAAVVAVILARLWKIERLLEQRQNPLDSQQH